MPNELRWGNRMKRPSAQGARGSSKCRSLQASGARRAVPQSRPARVIVQGILITKLETRT